MSDPSGSINGGKSRDDHRITTLHIRTIEKELTHDDMLGYFSAFGDVDVVSIHSETERSYGTVTFDGAESAAKALAVDCHVIAGSRVEIAAASDRHQNMISILEPNHHTTTFLDLNDDCILEILSMKCLNAQDFCSVAEASRRLKEIVTRVFGRKHRTKCDINSLSGGETKTAKRILRNFGSEIRHLKTSGGGYSAEWSGEILAAVTEHCSSSTLQSLELQLIDIPENLTFKLRPLFKNLQKLAIICCTFEGASKELLADCESLVALKISHCGRNTAFMFEKTFQKLQQFECRFIVDSNALKSFISRHINLKSLRIGRDSGSSVLRLIADCKHLDTLECVINQNETLNLSNLGRLTELDIHCDRRNVREAALGLNNLKFLEHLTIGGANIDPECVRTLSQLQRLHVLKFRKCSGLQNLYQIGELAQLTTLKIESSNSVDLDIALLVDGLSKLTCLTVDAIESNLGLATYLRIVDVVRRRLDRSKLTFRLYCHKPNDYDKLLPDFQRNAHLVDMILNR